MRLIFLAQGEILAIQHRTLRLATFLLLAWHFGIIRNVIFVGKVHEIISLSLMRFANVLSFEERRLESST